MPSTPNHKVAMHQLATTRRAAGQPVWNRKINLADVFHNEDMTFEQRRDAIAARLRGSKWYSGSDEDAEIRILVDDLGDAVDTDQFDAVWDAIYDETDYDRVWIGAR
jgi:hypothetical protein